MNFLLAEVIGKEKIEEAINSESLENDLNKESYKEEERQSLLKRKQRNKKIFVLSLSSVVLSFLWLIFYYKFDYIIKIKSYLYSFFNLDRLRS